MSSMKACNKVSFVVAIVAVGIIGSVASATTRYVYPDGHGTYPTIQSAIDASAKLDVVILADGTFKGTGNRDVDFKGKAILVRSQSGDPTKCIIDCEGQGRGFKFVNDEERDSELRGVTVTNASVPGTGDKTGGGVRCGVPGFPPMFPPHHGSPTITDCHFIGNSASSGGGMACTDDSAPKLTNCYFEDNSVSFGIGTHPGGGMYCDDSSPELYDCEFFNNSTAFTGGAGAGIFCQASVIRLEGCIFRDNTAVGPGGGLAANGGTTTLVDCTFSGNSGGVHGGGMYLAGTLCTADLAGCTFYGNSASYGGGMTVSTYAKATLQRTIIAMSTQGEAVYCYSNGKATISCCDVYGNAGGPGSVAGQLGSNNNFAAYPGFCGPGSGDLTIRAESPCAPANSPCGQLVGAWGVGCSGPMTFVVCPTPPFDFNTIQAAIDAAINGDTVELCDATFTGDGNRDLDYGGKAITVKSQSGNPQACIIDCGGSSHRGFDFHSGETNSAVLEGVKITKGHMADWPGGGGIICRDGSGPTIRNCVLTGNHTDHEGGGMYCRDSSPVVHDCVFSYNTSQGIGGGMIFSWGSPTSAPIARCTFSHNAAQDDGGGLAAFSHVDVQDCTFEYNDTIAHGGGVTCMGDAGGSAFLRCIFSHNTASGVTWSAGGGLSATVSLDFQECTFNDNSATTEGGGVYGNGGTFTNCTLYGNSAPNGGGVALGWSNPSNATIRKTIIAFSTQGQAVYCYAGSAATLTCCDVFGNAGGDWVGCIAGQNSSPDNFSKDPIFCDAAKSDFTLRGGSPCLPAKSPPGCGLIGAWDLGCYGKGDMDCDGDVDFDDIDPFVLALGGQAGYQAQYPNCDWYNADCNGDGKVDFNDIDPFVALIGG